jgi:uncharacterized RDD family membrane protein YckC
MATTPAPAQEAPARPEPGTPATYGRRFGALMIDWILCLLLANLVTWLAGSAIPHRLGNAVVPSVVLVLEYAIFVGIFAQTPGMRFARIRCASVTDGGRLGIPRALLRGVLLALFVPALIITGPGGRGLHDKAAGSIMVHA